MNPGLLDIQGRAARAPTVAATERGTSGVVAGVVGLVYFVVMMLSGESPACSTLADEDRCNNTAGTSAGLSSCSPLILFKEACTVLASGPVVRRMVRQNFQGLNCVARAMIDGAMVFDRLMIMSKACGQEGPYRQRPMTSSKPQSDVH